MFDCWGYDFVGCRIELRLLSFNQLRWYRARPLAQLKNGGRNFSSDYRTACAVPLILFLASYTEFYRMSWDLQHSTAKWSEPKWSVDVALSNDQCQPSIKVHDDANRTHLSIGIMPHELHGVHSAVGIQSADAYVRQKDLIAIFPETKPWQFGYQMDLRMLESSTTGILAIEFWLSIQTSLLDTYPQLELRFQGDLFSPSVANCWTSQSSSMGLLVHPMDEQDCQIKSENDGLRMTVFGRFMEKGVIRRMRFRLIVAPKSETARYWQERFEEFSGSPLPLTT